MASKSSKIIILLVIDIVFFFIELIIGYAVHSLALVADSFHMLNDVLSLLVGFAAVKMSNKAATSSMYTYGYQRAETLGALFNGAFLVALCVTIFLDAIQRFVEPQEVKSPMIVLIVGCVGLVSNFVGLFLFHDHGHGHSHGGHGQGEHSHGNDARIAEEGEAGHTHDLEHYHDEPEEHVHAAHETAHGDSQDAQTVVSGSTAVEQSPSKRRHSRATSRNYEIRGPSDFRNSIIERSHHAPDEVDGAADTADELDESRSNEPLLNGGAQRIAYGSTLPHDGHNHRRSKEAGKSGGHSHSHGDLNMRGIFLHVMGDALGNIGVIASALIIWLTTFEGRFYFDPAISLVITCIILWSAIPLCMAASRILLQAVPQGIEVDEIQEDIESLEGVDSCHHLHVWQLSDTKLVASLHVKVNFNFKGEGSQRYMMLASEIRECLHEYGIHNATIQPEFHPDHVDVADGSNSQAHLDGAGSRNDSSRNGSVVGDKRCLLDCGEDCGNGKSCCPPAQQQTQDGDDHSHDGHDHSH